MLEMGLKRGAKTKGEASDVNMQGINAKIMAATIRGDRHRGPTKGGFPC